MNPPIPAAEGASGQTSGNPLTASEQQILRLTAEGHTTKHIARAMGVSEHTVKYHVKSIHRKLGVASRTHAVAIALRNVFGGCSRNFLHDRQLSAADYSKRGMVH